MNQPIQDENRLDPGVVTSIKAQQKSRDRVSIFIDGTFAFGIHSEVLLHHAVPVGEHLSEKGIAALIEEDAYYRARDKAYHLLSYRQRSVKELSDRLTGKGHGPKTVSRVIDRLMELDMLDDSAFSIEFAAARVRSKGYGPGRIRNDLFKKGISPELIVKALDKAYHDVSPEELARAAGRKISDRLRRIDDPFKRRHRLTSYLARRGFSFDQMGAAVKELENLDRKEL